MVKVQAEYAKDIFEVKVRQYVRDYNQSSKGINPRRNFLFL